MEGKTTRPRCRIETTVVMNDTEDMAILIMYNAYKTSDDAIEKILTEAIEDPECKNMYLEDICGIFLKDVVEVIKPIAPIRVKSTF